MKSLVVLCTDPGYLVPSLVVADQVVKHAGVEARPAIVLYLNNFADKQLKEIAPVFRDLGLDWIPLTSDVLPVDERAETFFNRGISSTALMRLAVANLIPESYDRVLYLDGDMQVLSDIGPLLEVALPADQITAVSEAYVILKNGEGKPNPWLLKYMEDLGLGLPGQYFNSGVMLFDPKTWRRIAPKALDFFFRNIEICPNYDQSALNAVLGGSWTALHPAYNWHSYFNNFVVFTGFKKTIVHFSGQPKPWRPGHSGWHPNYYFPYRKMMDRFPVLEGYLDLRSRPALKDYARYYLGRLSSATKRRRYRTWFSDYLRSSSLLCDPKA